MKTHRSASWAARLSSVLLGLAGPLLFSAVGQPFVYLTDVPDYNWYAGCFGTASGNLAGFWDRHGYSNIYVGPIDGSVAPLRDEGKTAIQSLWASPAHMNDYYVNYESTARDPYVTASRTEHTPDCIGDFIGLSQDKWASLAGECKGNIDAYSFVFWDKTGQRRNNYYTTNDGAYVPDIGSGFKEWMKWRGYDADVFTQLADFNPERSTTNGFTYEDVKREIDSGNPVLCFLQPNGVYSRNNVNPPIHGVMIFGYFSDPFVAKGVVIRTSWGSGFDPEFPGLAFQEWSGGSWLGLFPVRGVIGFRPKPKVTSITRSNGNLTFQWDGPASYLHDQIAGSTSGPVQKYLVQRATNLNTGDWKTVAGPTTERTVTLPQPSDSAVFYRVVIQ